jgi:predicted O-methyltransferase YrrM
MSHIKSAIKRLVPKAIRRHFRLSQSATALREIYFGRQLKQIKPIVLATGETHNFTYDLTDENLRYLTEMIAVATAKPPAEIEAYINEVFSDRELRNYFDARTADYHGQKSPQSVKSPFGRRMGWYAVARTVKPRVIVETGVERGHGALLLCAALMKNERDGFAGRYYGTDIDPNAGWMLQEPYSKMGRVLYGDSLESLGKLDEPIDLFINDSDHSADYEAREYDLVAPKLSSRAIILGDNAHVTDKLARFSRNTGRSFLMFQETPKNHWYPGAGIGISFQPQP